MQLRKQQYIHPLRICLSSHEEDSQELNINQPDVITALGEKKTLNLKLKLLMVEDNKICQAIQKLILESFGCSVDIAGSGEKALTMFSNGYDVIILDVKLPGINGIEVSKAIRKLGHGKKIPIIGLTSENTEMHKECLAAGYNQVIAKPANHAQLAKILQTYYKEKQRDNEQLLLSRPVKGTI